MKPGPHPLSRDCRRANRVNAFVGDVVFEGLRAECATSRDMSEMTEAALVVYLTMPHRERDARLSAAWFNVRTQLSESS